MAMRGPPCAYPFAFPTFLRVSRVSFRAPAQAAKKAAKKGEDAEPAAATKPAAASAGAAAKDKKAKAAAGADVAVKVPAPAGASAASTPQMPTASPTKAKPDGGPADPSVLNI